jgi:hypothetical protein
VRERVRFGAKHNSGSFEFFFQAKQRIGVVLSSINSPHVDEIAQQHVRVGSSMHNW